MLTNKISFDESILYPSKKKQIKKENKRTFHAIYETPEGLIVLDGNYEGTKPRQAASKAFTKILQIFSKAGKELTTQIYFGLQESARKKNGLKKIKKTKCYWYTGLKKKLDNPAKSRTKKDLSTGKPYINPETGKPVIDPITKKEVIDPKTCSPLLDSSGNPVIIYHNFTNDVKKSKSIYCKHLLNFGTYDKQDENSISSKSEIIEIEKKPKKKSGKNNKK